MNQEPEARPTPMNEYRPIRLTGARIVTPSDVIEDHDVVLHGDLIASIEPIRAAPSGERVIDLHDTILIPGMIDVHADYIEHMAAPRPTSLLDLRIALREAERELISHGITTMFHSLALYGFDAFASSIVRQPETTRALIETIHASHDFEHLIHHRCHARFEIDNPDRIEEVATYIRDGRVHLLSFMDHTPGQGQYRDLEVFRSTVKAYKGLDDEGVERLIAMSRERDKLDATMMQLLTDVAHAHGVAVASHDDDSEARVDFGRSLGTTISEFPITLDVAHYARSQGMHTVGGAPNVLLGGSHSGNLSVTEAVLDGAIDVLCSDYYPPAMLLAVFRLHREHAVHLPAAIRLVTLDAARAVRIDHETGSIEEGKRADLLAVRLLRDGMPAVMRAWVSGTPVFRTEYRA